MRDIIAGAAGPPLNDEKLKICNASVCFPRRRVTASPSRIALRPRIGMIRGKTLRAKNRCYEQRYNAAPGVAHVGKPGIITLKYTIRQKVCRGQSARALFLGRVEFSAKAIPNGAFTRQVLCGRRRIERQASRSADRRSVAFT